MIVLRHVVGDSMAPTLRPGQMIIGVRAHRLLHLGLSFLMRPGRIVIIRHNGLEKIKRIKKLKNNQLYVLGDNPTASTDSRHFGWLPTEDALAIVIWPLRSGGRG